VVVIVIGPEPERREAAAEAEPDEDAEIDIEEEPAAETALWAKRVAEFRAARADSDWAKEAEPILSVEVVEACVESGCEVVTFECRGRQCLAKLRWNPTAPRSPKARGPMHHRYSYNCAQHTRREHGVAEYGFFLIDCDVAPEAPGSRPE
jgi:hypothetical protein